MTRKDLRVGFVREDDRQEGKGVVWVTTPKCKVRIFLEGERELP